MVPPLDIAAWRAMFVLLVAILRWSGRLSQVGKTKITVLALPALERGANAGDGFGGGLGGLLDPRWKFRSGTRVRVDAQLLCLIAIRRGLPRRVEGLAQRRDALARNARRQEERPADVEPRHHEPQRRFVARRLGEIERVRYAGQFRIGPQRPLRDDLDLLVGEPLRAQRLEAGPGR